MMQSRLPPASSASSPHAVARTMCELDSDSELRLAAWLPCAAGKPPLPVPAHLIPIPIPIPIPILIPILSSPVAMQIPALLSSSRSFDGDNYFRGCKWAPDGSCILTASNDNRSRLFNLPPLPEPDVNPVLHMEPALEVLHSDLMYDFTWYPDMNSQSPETCVFATTCGRDSIRLIDAYTGKTRATYRSFDHVERMATAHSICFSPDGSRIYAGYEKMIRIFRTAVPGTSCDEVSFYEEKCGQRGIFSCICFNPADRKMFAVASFSRQISISCEPDDYAFCVLEGQRCGVTHVTFSPDGNRLFSGGRRDPEILSWDIRNLGSVLSVMKRSADTNQRMFFDVNSAGEYLATGNTDGSICTWFVGGSQSASKDEIHDGSGEKTDSANTAADASDFPPLLTFRAHEDCVNGVSYHPSLPLLASCSGARKLRSISSDEEEELMFAHGNEQRENRLKIWSLQQQ